MAWPTEINVQRELWQPAFTVRHSGRTLAGSGQRVIMVGDVWVATASVVVRPVHAYLWDGWLAARQGGFDDFNQGPATGPKVPTPGSTTNTNAVLAGDVQMDITCADSALVLKGQKFGLDGYLYVIRSATVLTGTTADIDIWPPVRADVAASTTFDSIPRCQMRFTQSRFFRFDLDRPDVIDLAMEEVI